MACQQVLITETREVRIPAGLYSAAEKRFAGDFHSIDELVIFLLQELINRDTVALDQADQQAVEERLRDLGYI
jgi:hypothetical protein